MTSTTRDIIDTYYGHIRAGDYTALFDLFADDLHTVVGGRSTASGTFEGPAGIGEFYARMAAQMGGHFVNHTDPLLVDGDHAYAVENIEVNRSDDPDRLWHFRLGVHFSVRDGKIARIEATPLDPDVYDAYYSPIESPYAGKTFRFTYDSGFVFDVRYDTADTMSFETVGDPLGGTLVGEKGTNPIHVVTLGEGRIWMSWQEDTPLQTTVTTLMDFTDSTVRGYLTYRVDDATRAELVHAGTFTERTT